MSLMAEYQALPLSERIRRLVLEMSSGGASHRLLDGPLPQEALAALVGTTRQTVNRMLRSWEKAGLVSIEYGRIRVLDAQGLSQAADAARGHGDSSPGRRRGIL